MNNGDILHLTRAEILARMDRIAQHRLGLSAEAALRLYHAGRLDDPGRVTDLLVLSRLLPDDDPLLVPR